MLLDKILNKSNNTKIKGLTIKPKLAAPKLDIYKLDSANTLVFPLEDAKFNEYIANVKIGDNVKKGQVIATSVEAHGLKIMASYDGVISDITTVKAPLPQKTCQAIILTPDNPQFVFEDVFYNLDVHFAEYKKEFIFQKIVQANIQGLGGGLFLAGKKVLSNKIEHLVINGVECEPILNCDEALLTHHLAEVLSGALFLQKVANAKTITIVLKENKQDLIKHIQYFVNNNIDFKDIAVASVPDVYPAGAEKEILRYVFNKPLKAKDIATDHGFLMQNVMTAASVFRAVTCDLPQLERVVSVFGENITEPKNILVPVGATVEDILSFAKIKDAKSIRLGGLMMGEDIINDKSIKHTATLKSSNGIVLNCEQTKEESECINCGKCVDVFPVDLLPHKMFKAAQFDEFESKYLLNLNECINCSLCNAVCPSNIKLVEMFKYAKQEVHEIEKEKKRFEYIDMLTHKKMARTEQENQEKERIKAERKKAREERLRKKAEAGSVEATNVKDNDESNTQIKHQETLKPESTKNND